VDDLSMIFTHDKKETTHQNTNRITQSLSDMMERTGLKYKKLLHVAGGYLNLPKEHCYILIWKWDNRGISTMNKISDTPKNTNMTHGRDTTKVKIPSKETMEPFKTLGSHSAPSGSLLHVAGGYLNLPKEHCYILIWKWDNRGISTMNKIADTPKNTNMTHGRDTTKVKIPSKETTEPFKTLGSHSAPSGSNKGQYDALLTKAIGFGAAARHRGTKKKAYMKHSAYFFTGISFPLGVSNIPHKALASVERKLLKATKQ
jgi:hypothetical protein